MATNYFLNQYFTTTLNVGGGIDASQTTGIIVQAVSGLDITKPGVACITYADPINTSTAEWVTYTSIDGSNELQGVTRGAEGFGAKTHSNGAVIAFPLSESHINTLATALSIGGVATTGVTTTLDEDDMATNSATALATQQSIKAYVDGKKATGAEVTTGTEDAKYTTPKAIADAGVNTRLKSKTGTFTRDAAGTTANVAYTGVGFVPTSIVFTAVVSGAVLQSVGFADSAKGGKVIARAFDGNNYANLYTDACIAIAQATGSNDQWAKVATYDADGFTLTWTKVNSPTGTITVDYIAYS